MGTILHPIVALAPSQYSFGLVHVEKTLSVKIYLSNPTVVDANFTISHVVAPIPLTRAEKDRSKASSKSVDDPSVRLYSYYVYIKSPS